MTNQLCKNCSWSTNDNKVCKSPVFGVNPVSGYPSHMGMAQDNKRTILVRDSHYKELPQLPNGDCPSFLKRKLWKFDTPRFSSNPDTNYCYQCKYMKDEHGKLAYCKHPNVPTKTDLRNGEVTYVDCYTIRANKISSMPQDSKKCLNFKKK